MHTHKHTHTHTHTLALITPQEFDEIGTSAIINIHACMCAHICTLTSITPQEFEGIGMVMFDRLRHIDDEQCAPAVMQICEYAIYVNNMHVSVVV
jgi:hypothetical protein